MPFSFFDAPLNNFIAISVLLCSGIRGLKLDPDPDAEKFENWIRNQAKTPDLGKNTGSGSKTLKVTGMKIVALSVHVTDGQSEKVTCNGHSMTKIYSEPSVCKNQHDQVLSYNLS